MHTSEGLCEAKPPGMSLTCQVINVSCPEYQSCKATGKGYSCNQGRDDPEGNGS